ncbi:MAG: HlyD family efflux transporter periplasmic adaptor subunit [Eubacteriales bacterium]|nr:HlyD family efflux transporter periplasmic adaptor subunit [Eubacteriales bacterium]
MESFDTSFTATKKKKKKQKRTRNIILLCAAVVVITVGTILIVNAVKKSADETSTLNYRVGSVSSGEISTTISGSGTLSALESKTVTTKAESVVTAVNFAPGDEIKAGDTVLTMTSSEVESELSDLQDDLASTRSSLASAKQLLTNLKVTSGKAGIVKDIKAAEGTVVDDMDYLCLISTDGKMQLSIPVVSGMGQYDAVTVVVGEDEQEGYITKISGDTATVVFEDDYYPVGTSATVLDASGNTLGTGTITVNEYVEVTAASGKIATVEVEDNEKVGKGETIFTLAEGAPTATYTTLKKTEANLVGQIADLEDLLTVKADYDCTLTSLSAAVGDTVAAGTTVCVLTGTGGFTLSLSIDELDIASVALGQDATITLDALEGDFTGTVSNISYSGSGSYVTSYTATITTEPIEGAYPGMSASAEIVTDTSGDTMIADVSAVQYDGDTAFIYLAGDDAQLGTTLAEGELDLDKLTKVTVTTGMSDGSYIAITAEGLAAGDLIWIPERTSTATYSEDDSTTTTFSMGGQGGMMGGDSSGFTPPSGGQMPSGGGMPGGN